MAVKDVLYTTLNYAKPVYRKVQTISYTWLEPNVPKWNLQSTVLLPKKGTWLVQNYYIARVLSPLQWLWFGWLKLSLCCLYLSATTFDTWVLHLFEFHQYACKHAQRATWCTSAEQQSSSERWINVSNKALNGLSCLQWNVANKARKLYILWIIHHYPVRT